MIAETLIKKHEGFRSFVYKCTTDKHTIGYGRNIDALGGQGITEPEAEYLLQNAIHRIVGQIRIAFPVYREISYARQAVLVSTAYNLGVSGLLRFKRMLKAIVGEDFKEAADEMLDSRWVIQVPKRRIRFMFHLWNRNRI